MPRIRLMMHALAFVLALVPPFVWAQQDRPLSRLGATVLDATTATSLAINGATIGSNAFAARGTANISGATSSGSFIPTGSSVPTNGMFLAATNTPAFAQNGVEVARFSPSNVEWAHLGFGIGTQVPGNILEGKYDHNGETAFIVRNNHVGTSNAVGINFANDADDLDYQIYLNGSLNTGSGGARSLNQVYNYGAWVLWSNYTAPARVITATSHSDGNKVGIGEVASPVAKLHVKSLDGTYPFIAAGTTTGIRLVTSGSGSSIDGVDQTGVGSFQPLTLNGSILTLSANGTPRAQVDAAGLAVTGRVNATTAFQANGTPGISGTKIVRNSAGTGTCTLIFSLGLLIGGTC